MHNFTNPMFTHHLVDNLIKPVFALVKNIRLYFNIIKKDIIFVLTVPVLLPIRTAHGSFFFIGFPKPKHFSSFKCIKYG